MQGKCRCPIEVLLGSPQTTRPASTAQLSQGFPSEWLPGGGKEGEGKSKVGEINVGRVVGGKERWHQEKRLWGFYQKKKRKWWGEGK